MLPVPEKAQLVLASSGKNVAHLMDPAPLGSNVGQHTAVRALNECSQLVVT